ncbi:MAG: hypothetical protein E7Z93_08085 [Cyanobacteria bacterium SIG32]|nr:hypothetical protein [Cyanobacteria bacterium SIG32]
MNDYYAKPYMIERIVSALSYLTMGFAGFIWLILGLITRSNLRAFTQYHIFQSIFIAIAYFLLNMLCGFILSILSLVPLINKLVAQITFYLNAPLFGPYSLIQTVLYGIIIYLAVTSFMGKYSRIPWVSDIIDQNVGRH